MVEVFKTNVIEKKDSLHLIEKLAVILPTAHIHFDLEDCDKILRIETETIAVAPIIFLLKTHGFKCEILE